MNRYKFVDESDDRGKPQHLHTLDGKPLIGTSTALKVLSKPLTWWASGLAVGKMGWVKELKPYDKPKPTKEQIEANKMERLASAEKALNSLSGLTPEQYLSALDKAYRAHAEKLDESAESGTNMHEELEKYVKSCEGGIPSFQEPDVKAVKVFAKWARENIKKFLVSEGHCYSEEMWTGGILDLLCEDKKGNLVLLDFKSSKEAYLSQFIQDAGYAIAIAENGVLDKDGNVIYKPEKSVDYYGVFPFGAENTEPSFHYDTEGVMKGFRAAVVLYKLQNQN